MGLPISILARGDQPDSADADQAVRAVFAELVEVDLVFSPYRQDSVISQLMRNEIALSECPIDVQDVAERCARAKSDTGGLFDPVRPDGEWDPSGLVKGWAVERASRHLGEVTDLDWCLNAGGDVVVISPSGEPFTVGIQDPHDATRVAAALPCASGGVATSGTAARGEHLYDPRSGGPASKSASVTVCGPSLETADVLATAAFVAGDQALAVIERVNGCEGLRIGLDATITTTVGWVGRTITATAD